MTDTLVTLGITTLLVAAMTPAINRARGAGDQAACLSHLRQIGMAFLVYASENSGRLPHPTSMDVSWEMALKRYLIPDVFRCPADEEVFPALGSSYDWRDTGRPETTFAGQEISRIRKPTLILAFEALPAWHRRGKINAVRLDASTHVMDDEECFYNLTEPIYDP